MIKEPELLCVFLILIADSARTGLSIFFDRLLHILQTRIEKLI